MSYETFCGGPFDTNCYLLEAPQGHILFDAPEGAAEWLETRGVKPKLLLLTHGHYDHVPDVAEIKRRSGCQIGCHADTVPMISDPEFFKNYGFGLEIEPAQPDFLIEATEKRDFMGLEFRILDIPGHSPGSLCFYLAAERLVVGGDVLFAGGVGRWDLPGGDGDLLFEGIKTKLFTLEDDVTVLSGHGPATTIGMERRTNPFVHD